MPIYMGDELAPRMGLKTLLRLAARSLLTRPSTSPAIAPTPTPIADELRRTPGLERCDMCRFSVGTGAERECHRRPPALVYEERSQALISIWPTVDDKEWCGDFEQR